MDLDVHLITSLILVTIVFPFLGWISLFILIGGVLVDFDHYILYVIKKKDLSLKRGREYYTRREFKRDFPVLHVFHTVECFIALLALSFVHVSFFAVLLGFILHMLIDFFYTISKGWWTDRTNSAIIWIIRYSR